MEQLAASPRTTDLYGYCGFDVFVAAAKDLVDDVVQYNRGLQTE